MQMQEPVCLLREAQYTDAFSLFYVAAISVTVISFDSNMIYSVSVAIVWTTQRTSEWHRNLISGSANSHFGSLIAEQHQHTNAQV